MRISWMILLSGLLLLPSFGGQHARAESEARVAVDTPKKKASKRARARPRKDGAAELDSKSGKERARPLEAPAQWEIRHESPPRLVVLDPSPKDLPIEGLSWKSHEARVFVRLKGIEHELVAMFEGRLESASEKAGELLLGVDTRLAIENEGAFRIEIPVSGPETLAELKFVDLRGKVRIQKLRIEFPDWEVWSEAGKRGPPKRLNFSVGTGVSLISYDQILASGKATAMSELGLTFKGGVTYLLVPPRWSIGVSTYFTALPMFASTSPAARFLGLNLRAGYQLPQFRSPWKVSLLGGLYYTTMFVPGRAYGFQNMMGPQLFPTVSRELAGGRSASGYFKFSPVGGRLSVLSLANREIAFGGAYTLPLKENTSLSFTLDVAFLRLDLPEYGFQMSSSSVSVGAACGF